MNNFRNFTYSQNFLHSRKTVSRLINKMLSSVKSDDYVIEIGAGTGIITEQLINKLGNSSRLDIIEADSKLADNLRAKFASFPQVNIIKENILNYKFPSRSYKVISNLPFNYTTSILSILLNPNSKMQEGYFILQKEAFNMFAGKQLKNGKETLKSLKVYPYFKLEKILSLKREDFKPMPNVNTVFAKFARREEDLISKTDSKNYNNFLEIIAKDRVGQGAWKQIFTRKQLLYMYKNYGLMERLGISYQNNASILNAYNTYKMLVSNSKKSSVDALAKDQRIKKNKIEKSYRTRNRM